MKLQKHWLLSYTNTHDVIYSKLFSSKEGAIKLANKLSNENNDKPFFVYQCIGYSQKQKTNSNFYKFHEEPL